MWYFDLRVTAWRALLAALLLLITTLVWACIRGTASLLSFWTGRVRAVNFFVNVGRRFERYPIDIFAHRLRTALTWFVPAAFTATFPTMVLLGKPLDLGRVFAIALVLLGAWGGIWTFVSQKALARYEAFGG